MEELITKLIKMTFVINNIFIIIIIIVVVNNILFK